MGTVFGVISVEMQAYDALQQLSSQAQLRRYKPCVAVETVCEQMHGDSSSEAFRRLAKYIGVRSALSSPTIASVYAMISQHVRGARQGYLHRCGPGVWHSREWRK
uniref:Uncharacterized protein n=1 Tax=Chrysotila carterae TaxID=13221 RepID=A0A7S4BVD8_CHRCT